MRCQRQNGLEAVHDQTGGRVLPPSAHICRRNVGNTNSVFVVSHCGMCV